MTTVAAAGSGHRALKVHATCSRATPPGALVPAVCEHAQAAKPGCKPFVMRCEVPTVYWFRLGAYDKLLLPHSLCAWSAF